MVNGNLYVDHFFMLSDTAGEREVEALTRAGFTESCRRSHVGLGTANAFFCFDNVFLEILWIEKPAEAAQSRLARGLMERADWRSNGAAPFGIGFRTSSPDDPMPFLTWDYAAPNTAGLNPVQLAVSSDDIRNPVLFRAQRTLRPDAWTDGRAGKRQRPGGWAEVTGLQFTAPPGFPVSADLEKLARLGMLTLGRPADGPDLALTISRVDGAPGKTLSLRETFGLDQGGKS